jgi:hypothetical protein
MAYKDITVNILRKLTEKTEKWDLECDGSTRVIHSILADKGIEHTIYMGSAIYGDNEAGVSPHFWIECEGYIIDYKLRMWLPDYGDDVPNGVFKVEDTKITYEGRKVKFDKLQCDLLLMMSENL